MAELADARDLKSREIYFSYRFDPGFRHHSSANNLYHEVETAQSKEPKKRACKRRAATMRTIALASGGGEEQP